MDKPDGFILLRESEREAAAAGRFCRGFIRYLTCQRTSAPGRRVTGAARGVVV